MVQVLQFSETVIVLVSFSQVCFVLALGQFIRATTHYVIMAFVTNNVRVCLMEDFNLEDFNLEVFTI